MTGKYCNNTINHLCISMASHHSGVFRKENLASEIYPIFYAVLRTTKFGIDTYHGIDSIV